MPGFGSHRQYIHVCSLALYPGLGMSACVCEHDYARKLCMYVCVCVCLCMCVCVCCVFVVWCVCAQCLCASVYVVCVWVHVRACSWARRGVRLTEFKVRLQVTWHMTVMWSSYLEWFVHMVQCVDGEWILTIQVPPTNVHWVWFCTMGTGFGQG